MSKTITRKYIQRITKREGNTNIRQSSGGGGGGGGGASQYWVEENYISKLFFNQLFTVYDEDGNVVEPNDTESVIASIKSMFGFWTDAYLSALGNGEGGGAELTLASLADVDVHGVANGQALVYDAYTQKWVPGQAGLDPTSLWQELGSLGTEQISSTHLTTALSTYNPTNNFKTINGYSIIGTGNINVGGGGGAYLPLSGGTLTGDLIVDRNNEAITIGKNDSTYVCMSYVNTTASWSVGVSANGFYFWNSFSGTIRFLMTRDGKLGVNTDSPSYNLHVNGTAKTGKLIVEESSGDSIEIQSQNTYGCIVYSAANSIKWAVGCNTDDEFYFYNSYLAVSYLKITKTGQINSKGELVIDKNNEAITIGKNDSTYACVLYKHSSASWAVGVDSGNFYFWNSVANATKFLMTTDGKFGVNTTSPSYTLHVAGVAYASTGVYSGGYVTALSDIRHKDVQGNVRLTVREIANAPSVKFLWKDRRQEGMQVGSIAQYWKKVMPEAIVENAAGELTMSYGVIALLASIVTARKVEDHERRIAELERENKLLKEQLNVA